MPRMAEASVGLTSCCSAITATRSPLSRRVYHHLHDNLEALAEKTIGLQSYLWLGLSTWVTSCALRRETRYDISHELAVSRRRKNKRAPRRASSASPKTDSIFGAARIFLACFADPIRLRAWMYLNAIASDEVRSPSTPLWEDFA